jgi:hypothetical protein
MTDRYGRWSPHRIPAHQATYQSNEDTTKIKEF